MIGVNACQRLFCITFAFLSSESEEDYLWALDRLQSLYKLCNTHLPFVILIDQYIAYINVLRPDSKVSLDLGLGFVLAEVKGAMGNRVA